MRYFSDVNHHAEATFGRSRPEVVRICQEITRYVEGRDPERHLHLTLSHLRNQTKPLADVDLLLAIQYLTGAEAGLLETNFEYLAEGGEYVPLTRTQVSKGPDAVSEYLGVTFSSAQEFESRVLLYFSLSERTREALRRELA